MHEYPRGAIQSEHVLQRMMDDFVYVVRDYRKKVEEYKVVGRVSNAPFSGARILPVQKLGPGGNYEPQDRLFLGDLNIGKNLNKSYLFYTRRAADAHLYGTGDSGQSLGDILAKALKETTMKNYAILIERCGSNIGDRKIRDIKDFRSMFMCPLTGASLMTLTGAKAAVEAAYSTLNDVIVLLSVEQYAALRYNITNGPANYGMNWSVVRTLVHETSPQPVVLPVHTYND